MSRPAALIVAPEGGRRLAAGGNRQWVKVEAATGAEGLSMFEAEVPAGGGVSPHLHRSYEEAFYVLSGEVSFLIGKEAVEATQGTSVFVPRGAVHAFRNGSGAPVRLLVLHSPARALGLIDELATLAGPDPARAAAVMVRHDSAIVPVLGW